MFGEGGYMELHNALTDAEDELRIMKHLKRTIEEYPNLQINFEKIPYIFGTRFV